MVVNHISQEPESDGQYRSYTTAHNTRLKRLRYFREVSFIGGRLSALEKPELIPIVLNNLERLAPVAHSIAAFFKRSFEYGRCNEEGAVNSVARSNP
jgi:hypothetical protein